MTRNDFVCEIGGFVCVDSIQHSLAKILGFDLWNIIHSGDRKVVFCRKWIFVCFSFEVVTGGYEG